MLKSHVSRMRLSHFDVSLVNVLLAAVHPALPVSLPLLCADTIKNLDLPPQKCRPPCSYLGNALAGR